MEMRENGESKMEGVERGMTLGHWNVSQRTRAADPLLMSTFFQRAILWLADSESTGEEGKDRRWREE